MSSHSSASPNQIEATLRQLFLQLPNSQTWPLLNEIWHKATEPEQLRMAWRLPLLSCEAVGGELKTAVFGVAAIGCMQLSIIFVDDVLDDDVNGVHQRYGAGVAANLAVALQGTAVTLLQQAPITESVRWQVAHCLSQMALDTAVGQYLDTTPHSDVDAETMYWRIVRAKSGPFFGAGLKLGAILSQASESVADQLYQLGQYVGDMVQIGDDLEDIFDKQPHPDWQHPHKNLLLLYATLADYPQKQEFQQKMAKNDFEAVRQILVDIGAVHYALHTLQETQTEALSFLSKMTDLKKSEPITQLLKQHDPLIEQLGQLLA